MLLSDISEAEPFRTERQVMVETQLRNRGIRDPRVLSAMLQIPRHAFAPPEFRSQAYEDHPIPIDCEQTISQPFIVARSLQALALNGSETVLEVGTGSGYQTALLGILASNVHSIERHAGLARDAATILSSMGLNNVRIVVGDGSRGLREYAPYDAVLVSAAAPSVPESLLQQLSSRGRMVIPVGPPHAQELQLVKMQDAQAVVQTIEGCRFVPLIGAEGY